MLFAKSLFTPDNTAYKINLALNQFLILTDDSLQEIFKTYREACLKYINCTDVINLVSHRRVPWSKVISHYDKGTIFYNPKMYATMKDHAILGNLAHESFHHLGYKHSVKYHPERKYNEAYYLGYWVSFYHENEGNVTIAQFVEHIKGLK